MPNLAAMLIGLERFSAGLRRHSVQVGNHRVAYSEGGKGEPLVLVHGFGASADNWNRMAGRLAKRYRLIIPDLPGWGESTRIDSESYSYPQQIERLHQFLGQLGLRRFHLMGHSMGGFIASAYAAQYPEEVITLGLIAPHGMAEPEQSELARSVAAGDNWLVASTEPEFDRLLNNVFAKRPYLPRPVLRHLARHAIRGSAKSATIFTAMQSNDPPLQSRLPGIKAPALIIWGEQDRVLHVSAARLFQQGIANSEILLLPGSGHMPLLENVRQCADAWLAFQEKMRQVRGAAA
ncbi:MAG TPA: alpha/beta fold hydrolase [Candidatus Angelobacter sp.]|nr:alpha/beta fold hydrolase [Candidatus Angelobacter sp.]